MTDWAKRHRERWPRCRWGDAPHSHTEQLNGPPLVNGRPAGPLVWWMARTTRPYRPGDLLAATLNRWPR